MTVCEMCADATNGECEHCLRDERDRYRDALRILRVTADFHQRNIIDKALNDEQ